MVVREKRWTVSVRVVCWCIFSAYPCVVCVIVSDPGPYGFYRLAHWLVCFCACANDRQWFSTSVDSCFRQWYLFKLSMPSVTAMSLNVLGILQPGSLKTQFPMSLLGVCDSAGLCIFDFVLGLVYTYLCKWQQFARNERSFFLWVCCFFLSLFCFYCSILLHFSSCQTSSWAW